MASDDKQERHSLMDELADVNNLLERALSKAKHIENQVKKQGTSFDSNKSEQQNLIDEENVKAKPSNWDALKNMALQDSIDAMEEDTTEYSQNTTQARQIKSRTKKLRIDDNWEDDPI